MNRRSLLNVLSNEEQALERVWKWFEFQRTLIGEEVSRVFGAMTAGQSPQAARYQLKTRDELQAEFDFQVSELALVTMLGLLSSAEATIRVDFVVRVRQKRKDEVSRRLYDVFKVRGIEKVRLEEDLLDCWRNHGTSTEIKAAVSAFKGALNLRHWLAHGRWWRPRLGQAEGYDPVDVFDICRELLKAMELVPNSVPI